MKKNTKTYVLLGVVALIWGIIGYRIISAMYSDPEPVSTMVTADFKPLPVQEKDTFNIQADYRDPFLGTLPKKSVKKTKRSSKPKVQAPEITIEYTGFVADKEAKDNIFFVTINGQQHLMGQGTELDKVKLLSGTAAAIKVRYYNKTKTITRKE